MATKINPQLLQRLKDKLELSQSALYARIDKIGREQRFPRHVAALALAAQSGIGISRYASPEDWAELRGSARAISARAPEPPSLAQPAAPQSRPSKVSRAKKKSMRQGPRNTVFVVHGRDGKVREAMYTLLRALNLKPLEWNQLLHKTRHAAPYVGQVLDTAFREAAAVVVLLTPDDEARLKPQFWNNRDGRNERQLTGQARANVLFEAGLAFAHNPRSTVLVQVGDVRPFSDVAGRHVVHMTGDVASRQELATKLEAAGCEVDRNGTDWLTAGNFAPASGKGRKGRKA